MAEKKLFNLLLTEDERSEISKYSEKERQSMAQFILKATFDRINDLQKEEKEE